ncbi:MAG: SBBP repeat-containing protein [Bryobacteraceae bacterium]
MNRFLLAGALLAPSLFAQSPATLAWSSYLSGNRSDLARAVVTDAAGNVWVAGNTSSVFDFPGPNDPFQNQPKGGTDVFVAKYKPEPDGKATLLFWTWLGGAGDDEVAAIGLNSSGHVCLTGATTSNDFPLTGISFQQNNAGEADTWVAVIDPSVAGAGSYIFGSYYGGTRSEIPKAIFVEPGGAMVIAGYTSSTELPNVTSNVQGSPQGAWETFFIRVDPTLSSTLTYASFFGGSATDVATGVAVDRNGVIWITGYTTSDNFPVTGNAYRATKASYFDCFLAAIDPGKPGLDAHVYGTYFGGGNREEPTAMIIDSSGAFWITGFTFSNDFPITAAAAYQREISGEIDGFVMRLDLSRPPSEVITYSTYIGGSGFDLPNALTLLPDGRVAVSGYTILGEFPTAGRQLQQNPGGGSGDGFVAIINTRVAGPAALEYSSYVGGRFTDNVVAMAPDGAGGLILAGYTTSPDFPVTDGSTRQNPAILPSGFLARITR